MLGESDGFALTVGPSDGLVDGMLLSLGVVLGKSDGRTLAVGLPDGLVDGMLLSLGVVLGESDGPALKVGELLGAVLPEGVLEGGASGRGTFCADTTLTRLETAESTRAAFAAMKSFMERIIFARLDLLCVRCASFLKGERLCSEGVEC